LVAERNLARNTQLSYRDALTLLIPFVADQLHQSVDRLTVTNVSADLVRLFLTDLEQSRSPALPNAGSGFPLPGLFGAPTESAYRRMRQVVD